MSCGKMIEGTVVGYPCSLDEVGHDGPCMAVENARSVRERNKWEQEQQVRAEAERSPQEILAEFQGPALTTAEGMHEGATPVPGTEVEEPVPVTGPEYLAESVVEDEYDEARMRRTTSDDFLTPEDYQQPGDQPLPQIHDGVAVQDRIISKIRALADRGDIDVYSASRIIAVMEESKMVGKERYGTALQIFNGRDALKDLEDELRDAFVYVSGINQARAATREEYIDAVLRALEQSVGERGLTAEDIAAIAVDTIIEATAAGVV